ncbi:MAG TPA: hypothetical protein VGM63_12000 [Mucilaginibacter sp.]
MKPKLFTAILLFVSAYSPLFLILAVKDFDFKKIHRFNHPVPVYVLLGLIVMSIFLLIFTVTNIKRGNMLVEVVSAKNRSVDIIGYTIPYMVAFIGIDLSKPDDLISLSIFLMVLLLLIISSKAIFLNPILVIAGYGLYDFEYKYNGNTYSITVISRYETRKGEFYYIRNLTRSIYFVSKQEK